MIMINQFQYYFRWYPFEMDESTTLWWYSRKDDQVVQNTDLSLDAIRIANEEVTPQRQMYIPIGKVDMVALEQDFLKECGLQHLTKEFLSSSKFDFDCVFKRYMDHANLMPSWHKFEAAKLRDAAINWCRKYAVRYRE